MLLKTYVWLLILNVLQIESIFNPLCYLKNECCTKGYILKNVTKLQELLSEKVYGQHLAQQGVVNALRAHYDTNYKAPKALTLSFHGWPGSGKNYVSTFIEESLYYHGSNSQYVHHFIARLHFPLAEKTEEYQRNLYNWIKGNVTACPWQLFIFDEVDKMPSKVLNAIKPLIDYHNSVEGIDYRQSIFIFLSNTGSHLVNSRVLELWKDGLKREELRLSDFEKIISQGAFNEEGWLSKDGIIFDMMRSITYYYDYFGKWFTFLFGGFHLCDNIKYNLIDHYIPFLPMEYKHVRMCILDEFKARNVLYPEEKYVKEVMDFIEWGPTEEKLFSKTGCKRISQKVGITVSKHRLSVKDEL